MSFCSLCFSKLNKTDLKLIQSDTDDPVEVLSLKVSRDQKYFAIIAGKNQIKCLEELRQIKVYEIISKNEFREIKDEILDEKYYTYSKTFDFSYRSDNPDGEGMSLLLFN